MLYEIVNPSDAYTMEAETPELACVANLLIGNGAYGLRPESGDDPKCPLFLFGDNSDSWAKERLGCTIGEFLDANSDALASVLESVLIGSFADRAIFVSATEKMNDVKRVQFANEWHDKKRSSMNDIGARAWAYAKRLRKKKALVHLPAQ